MENKNRVDVDINYKDRDEDHFYNRMLYLQGPAFGGTISLGKIDYADFANMEIGYGMIYDDYLKGGKFTYKDAKSDIVYTTAVGNFDSPHNDKNNGMLKIIQNMMLCIMLGYKLKYQCLIS